MASPGWVPRGGIPDPYSWSYDLKRGKWIAPGDEVKDDARLVQMPPDFDPKGRGQGVQVVLSPPGVPAPPGALAYTPDQGEVHPPGAVPPIDLENLSVILAPRPGPPRPPPAPPQAGPMSPPGAVPGAMPPPQGGPPPGPAGMGPPPMQGVPPQSAPPGTTSAAAPPAQPPGPPPQRPMVPGVGKPPSLYAQKAHDILQSLLGTANPVPTGMGQDVGVGSDVGVGAALPRPGGQPVDYVPGISQNTLPPDMAATACGPAAAIFATRMGRQPTAEEAANLRTIAIRHGWSPGGGMTTGPDGVIAIARELGVTLERGRPDPERMRNDATAGLPVILSTARGRTPGHYWQVEDYDASSGKFVMGDAVGSRAPNRLMSVQDVENHGAYGGPVTALYVAGESRAIDRQPSARATGTSGGMQLLSSGDSGDSGRGGGQISQWDDLIRRYAAAHLKDDQDFIYAVNVGIHGESGGDPNRKENGGPAVGLFQIQDPVNFDRTDPEASARYMMPRYVEAWRRANDEHPDWSLQDRAILTAAYAERPRGITRGPGGGDRFDMNSAAAANYRRAANSLPTPGQPTLSTMSTLPVEESSLPDWMRAGISQLVDRAQEAPDAGTQGPNNIGPAGWARGIIGGTAQAAQSALPAVQGAIQGATQRATQAAQAVAPALRSAQGLAPTTPRQAGPSSAQAAPSDQPNWGTTPGPTGPQPPLTQDQWGRVPFQPSGPRPGYTDPVPARPADPRLTMRDPDGVPMYGAAGTIIPVPGVDHLPWKIYGPDEGDGLGRQIDDPEAVKAAREWAQREYMRRLADDERNANNEENRRLAREKMEIAQLQFRQSQDEINARAALSREQRQAELENRQWQFANQLVGPEGAQVARRMAPNGLIVDHVAGLAYALGEDGGVMRTFQVPRPAPKGVERPGYGRMEETIDPNTRQLTYRDTGQYGQTVVNGRVLSESPRGLEQIGRLSVDPEVERWTDPWGREHLMNRRTGESLVLNEGMSQTKQIGRRTYNVPPPEIPRYVPPLFNPTTYGSPEIQQRREPPLLPGVTRTERGTYLVPTALLQQMYGPPADVPVEQPPPPQFLNPDQESGTIGEDTQPVFAPLSGGAYG